MTTYTVLDADGYPIDRHLTAAEAAHIILTDDGREYEIRPFPNDNLETEWELWSRQPVANRGWEPTVVFSILQDQAEAEAEIFAKVIDARWPRHPEAMTDEAYDRMMAELEDAE